MTTAQRAKWLLEGKSCETCKYSYNCERNQKELLVCSKWEIIFNRIMMPIIRKIYPSMIKNNLVSVQQMMEPEDVIYPIEPTYGNEEKEN